MSQATDHQDALRVLRRGATKIRRIQGEIRIALTRRDELRLRELAELDQTLCEFRQELQEGIEELRERTELASPSPGTSNKTTGDGFES